MSAQHAYAWNINVVHCEYVQESESTLLETKLYSIKNIEKQYIA